ncbi:putative lipoprotein, partial [Escherichia coli 96.0109]
MLFLIRLFLLFILLILYAFCRSMKLFCRKAA